MSQDKFICTVCGQRNADIRQDWQIAVQGFPEWRLAPLSFCSRKRCHPLTKMLSKKIMQIGAYEREKWMLRKSGELHRFEYVGNFDQLAQWRRDW